MKFTASMAMLIATLGCVRYLREPPFPEVPQWLYWLLLVAWVFASLDFIFCHRVVKA